MNFNLTWLAELSKIATKPWKLNGLIVDGHLSSLGCYMVQVIAIKVQQFNHQRTI